jgi:hypothetical protein
MTKSEKLQRAIKFYIEAKYPNHTLSEIIVKLDLNNKGDLSKILNLKVLPTIEKIFHIEDKLGIEILKINFPDVHQDYFRETSKQTDNSLLNVEIKKYFGTKYDELISMLEKTIMKLDGTQIYRFEHRKKKNYDSINLVNKDLSIGGIHLLMIRFSERKRLRIHFVAPDMYLEKHVNYKEEPYPLKKTDIDTIYVPSKHGVNMKDYKHLPGQPALNIESITPEVIEKVCSLTKLVYQIQSNKM